MSLVVYTIGKYIKFPKTEKLTLDIHKTSIKFENCIYVTSDIIICFVKSGCEGWNFFYYSSLENFDD